MGNSNRSARAIQIEFWARAVASNQTKDDRRPMRIPALRCSMLFHQKSRGLLGETPQMNSLVTSERGGFNMPSPWVHVKVFLEARYFNGLTNNITTAVAPITFGIRW